MSVLARVSGVVHSVGSVESYGQKGFRKRTVVLEQPGKYSNYIPLEFAGTDACESSDRLKVGDEIEAQYEPRGRLWQKTEDAPVKCFVNLEVRHFDVIRSAAPEPAWADTGSEEPF